MTSASAGAIAEAEQCLSRVGSSPDDNQHPQSHPNPFGFDATAAELIGGIDLSGKRAIVTGGSSGIGIETARGLASAGAEVTLAVRDTLAGDRTASDITSTTGNAVHVDRLDLADQASVATFVAE
jgi:pyruvate/2-oxoglutarate dehydrogenase complex dihydrolipoamide dehydrogenase (E3) component